ncbi:terpene cyclase [Favolaschia claudopus]|uniref:Terpene synthase n=1 Tax=Favolaschia claudopus TaxID=2862362 RepID=A0AAW0EH67_9AGAR
MRGQALKFPNLDLPMKDWPKGISTEYEELKMVQHTELKKLVGEGRAYEICVSTDCPYLASTWFPYASWEGLRLASQVITFLYLWDDAIDTPELTDMCYDCAAGNKFRQDSRDLFNRYLARILGPARGSDAGLIPPLRSFIPIGEACAFRMSEEQRDQILSELNKYMDACDVEQHSEMSGQAPTIEEYLPRRMGTSAVGFVVACLEYILGIELGNRLRSDEDVKAVFNETVVNIAITNDILSLRRELRYPFYNNAVAVLYHQHRDLQTAVDETHKIILASINRLEVAAKNILKRYPERREDLTTWIDGCKTMCTGNLRWSLHIARYALGVDALDGTTGIRI